MLTAGAKLLSQGSVAGQTTRKQRNSVYAETKNCLYTPITKMVYSYTGLTPMAGRMKREIQSFRI